MDGLDKSLYTDLGLQIRDPLMPVGGHQSHLSPKHASTSIFHLSGLKYGLDMWPQTGRGRFPGAAETSGSAQNFNKS